MKKIIEVDFYARYKPQRWRRMLRAMKITTAIILIGALHVCGSGLAQKISFSGVNVPLTKVFNTIEDQLGFGVLMSHKLIEASKPVSVSIHDGTLDDLLQQCFLFQPWKLTYTVAGHTIFISRAAPPPFRPEEISSPAKTFKVEGAVYNELREPLAGANVFVKAIGKGTITDAKGMFSMSNVPTNGILTISFIGYTIEKVKAIEGETIKVYLKVANSELDKAVVQAYGTTTQRLSTGDVGTVTAQEIERQPVMNPLQALQGEVPGLVITQNNGYASAPLKVEIRGRNAIDPTIPGEPLYVIDGVPLTILEVSTNVASNVSGTQGFLQNGLGGPAGGQSPFFNLDPADIESVEVLKDADATAIYGSRAANGVILITTKKGSKARPGFDVNISQGITTIIRYWNMLNTPQYLAMRREAFANDDIQPTAGNAPDLLLWDTTRYTNWQKVLWGGTGRYSNVQLALSGGNANTSFRLGGGFNRETSILTASGADQQASISFNINHSGLDQKFNLGFTGSYSYTQSDMISFPPNAATLPPNAPAIYDENGQLNFDGWGPDRSNFPFGALLQPYTAKTSLINMSLTLGYQILRGLTIRTAFGFNSAQNSQQFLTPIASQDSLNLPTGMANFGINTNTNWIVEPQVDYGIFLGRGKLTLLLGGSAQGTATEGYSIAGSGYTSDALIRNISNAPYQFTGDNYGTYRYAAAFTRLNYNWENKYLLNLSARRDGSSNFGPGKQYGSFGAVGGAWIFTEENWPKEHLPFLSFGKVRGSYGTTGGEGPQYGYISRFASVNPPYANIIPLVPTQHANPNYHWEVDKKMEAALDLGLLKDWVNISVAYYRNRCNNQLVAFPIPSFTGFPRVTANSPANVQNSGVEISARSKIIDSKDIKWSVNFNIAFNRNKLLAYPDIQQSPYFGVLIVGQSLNIQRLLHYIGVDPMTGTYAYQDKNKDGVIDPYIQDAANDLYNYDLNPKYNGGLGTTLSYKNWSLSLFFYFTRQLGRNAYAGLQAGTMNNMPIAVLDRWQSQGNKAAFARFTTQPVSSDYLFSQSDGTYTDASFIRLQNLAVSYRINTRNKKSGIFSGCNIFFHTQNLFILTHYKGLDPETQNFGGMPLTRTLNFGISTKF